MDWIWAAVSALGAIASGYFALLTYRRSVRVDWEITARHRLLSQGPMGEELDRSDYFELGYWAWLLTNTGEGVARNVDVVFDFDPSGVTYGKFHFPQVKPNETVWIRPKSDWPSLGGAADLLGREPQVAVAHADITWGKLEKPRRPKRVRVHPMPLEHG